MTNMVRITGLAVFIGAAIFLQTEFASSLGPAPTALPDETTPFSDVTPANARPILPFAWPLDSPLLPMLPVPNIDVAIPVEADCGLPDPEGDNFFIVDNFPSVACAAEYERRRKIWARL